MTNESIKSALESILFVWGDPLEAKTAAELFNLPVSDMLHIHAHDQQRPQYKCGKQADADP